MDSLIWKMFSMKGYTLKKNIFLCIAAAALLWSCAEEVASPPSVSHPPGWKEKSAENFHGSKVLANMASGLDSSGTASCQTCHGEKYDGGSSGVACANCHPTFPHPPTWLDKNSELYHGAIVISSGTDSCETCHGADLKGGISGVACSKCHATYPHPPDWMDKNSDNFHGDAVFESGLESCKACHGENLDGGWSGVACSDCHGALFPHPDGWVNPTSQNFHGMFIRNEDWSMESCTSCHGSDYAGGTSGVSCITCHTQTGGPEACNTCHGNFSGQVADLKNWAPPEDLNKNTDTGSKGVGSHQVHLNPMNVASVDQLACLQCHRQLTGFDDPNHIKGGVQLQWHPLATDSDRVTPVWSAANATCADVYCHGNFEFSKESSAYTWAYTADAMTGYNPTIDWTKVGTGQTECGKCHGLPPTGHFPQEVEDCYVCHGTVVDNAGNIIDKTRHIDGKINVFDN